MAQRDQLDLLIKLLKLTNSPNDAEALAASRKANAILTLADWQWDTLLQGKVTIIADPFETVAAPPPPPSKPNWRPPSPPPPRPPSPPPPPPPPPPPRRPRKAQKATLADLGL